VIGYTQANFDFFNRHEGLGPDYIRALLKQELQILKRDDNLSGQWLAQGKYPLCLCSDIVADDMIRQGLPVKQVDPRRLKEGGGVTSSYGSVAVFDRAPHPEAARVFIYWLLSREGQTIMSKNTLLPSTRVDIPTDSVNPLKIPQPGWVVTYGEDVLADRARMIAVVDEVLGKQ